MAIAAVVLAAATGCSAHRRDAERAAETPAPPATAHSDSPKADAAAGRITEAAFNEDSDGARVVLSSDAPLLYTSYEPRPDLLVFDFPGVTLAEGFAAPAVTGALVQSVQVEPITELGKTVTRMTIAHAEGSTYEIGSIGKGLAIAFAPSGAASSTAERPAVTATVMEPEAGGETLRSAEAGGETLRSPRSPLSPETPEPPRGEPAHTLEEIVATPAEGGVAISLLGDGSFSPKDFVLANPPRIVVDLPGVKNAVARRTIPVKGGLVSRVRVSQFQTTPELVTRIVVDLARPVPHVLASDGERLSVHVGAPALAEAVERAPSRTMLADASAAAPPPAAPAPLDAQPAEPSQSSGDEASAPAETKKPEPAGEPAAQATATQASSEPAPAMTTSSVAVAPAPSPEPVPARITGAAARPAAKAPPSREEALFEAAAAMLDQEEPPRVGGAAAYQSRTLAEAQTQFTGEPISLDLKDADIKDVFRTISQLTGLNIVIDPEVRGTVTVQLENVPWDQALDLILKQNSLGYVLENNIMRIATTAKLQAEQSDRSRLAEARQAAEPTRTVIKKLSYARAGDITPTLKSVMSRRGDIVVDARTNTLIIREIPTFLPAVMQLIENLDTSTPQVMIESRIVETTKTLGRSLGINWGFNAAADVAHGNTTNLVFPNNVDATFRVPLEAGSTIGAIRLGNILDSFNLDIALTAAENQGLLKIISSPKVAALTNTPALIQSGVQIPVQTNVNNTTTVIYVDATLKLEVTPQITAEGTILLDVNVQKREPAVALNISLGQNVPLRIQEYRGQILVRDGGTTVIGGIFQINDQDQNNMIPGLWKIPILGNLFRNKTSSLRHDELLIFITPRILR
jgi:type IV pilus assembly protein PilQ